MQRVKPVPVQGQVSGSQYSVRRQGVKAGMRDSKTSLLQYATSDFQPVGIVRVQN